MTTCKYCKEEICQEVVELEERTVKYWVHALDGKVICGMHLGANLKIETVDVASPDGGIWSEG